MERFFEGQRVVCISEDFPQIRTTNKDKSELGKQSILHPTEGETLVIDEMLGLFLRFDKYDTDSFNWWHSSRFKPLDEIDIIYTEKSRLHANCKK